VILFIIPRYRSCIFFHECVCGKYYRIWIGLCIYCYRINFFLFFSFFLSSTMDYTPVIHISLHCTALHFIIQKLIRNRNFNIFSFLPHTLHISILSTHIYNAKTKKQTLTYTIVQHALPCLGLPFVSEILLLQHVTSSRHRFNRPAHCWSPHL
jgi:hypothetical protein